MSMISPQPSVTSLGNDVVVACVCTCHLVDSQQNRQKRSSKMYHSSSSCGGSDNSVFDDLPTPPPDYTTLNMPIDRQSSRFMRQSITSYMSQGRETTDEVARLEIMVDSLQEICNTEQNPGALARIQRKIISIRAASRLLWEKLSPSDGSGMETQDLYKILVLYFTILQTIHHRYDQSVHPALPAQFDNYSEMTLEPSGYSSLYKKRTATKHGKPRPERSLSLTGTRIDALLNKLEVLEIKALRLSAPVSAVESKGEETGSRRGCCCSRKCLILITAIMIFIMASVAITIVYFTLLAT